MSRTASAPAPFDPDAGIVEATSDDPRNRQGSAAVARSPDCIKILDLEGRIVFMSRNGLCAMEIADHEDVRGQIWWELWPPAMRETVKASFESALKHLDCAFYGSCPTARGTPKDWEVSVRPVMNGDLAIASVLSVSRDVTPPARAA